MAAQASGAGRGQGVIKLSDFNGLLALEASLDRAIDLLRSRQIRKRVNRGPRRRATAGRKP